MVIIVLKMMNIVMVIMMMVYSRFPLPASAREAARTLMLTRHFLSRRTTANCCRLLLHIKEDISL